MDEKRMQNYKKYTFVLLLVTAAALIVCTAAISFKRIAPARAEKPQATVPDYYTPKQAASQGSAAPQAAAPADNYRVAIYNGKIAVFKAGESEPQLITETEAYLLPQEDIDLLRKGIPASTMAQVRAILEDFDASVTLDP